MVNFFKKARFICILLVSVLVLSCDKEDPILQDLTDEELDLRNQLVAIMNYWYLWNDEVPDIDVRAYESMQDLMDAMIKDDLDKWSYVTDESSYDQYFKQGTYAGHGFGMRYDDEGKLRVSLVYPGSPADSSGVTRGFNILEINGKSVSDINDLDAAFGADVEGVVNEFKFLNTEGEEVTKQIGKAQVDIVTVLHESIIEQNGKKIGYLVFNNFIERAETDLANAFADFAENNIDELVLDMRYNGGGLLNLATMLSGMITSADNNGDLFVELEHNTDRTANNSSFFFESEPVQLGLNRVVIITTSSSASASEAVVNCLKPYIEVKTVGTTSYGKPVGSYGFRYEGYIISPISFRVVNANGVGDYFSGIPVDSQTPDDLSVDFGNTEEACLKEALYYLESGDFNNSGSRTAINSQIQMKNRDMLKGWKAEIGAF
ncbi:S41 family peptidase [Chondrinema litorale]|uniref:S41 family peptidase n=1 Tax=Chondrinema litorale TaxID=2994555 RepID=UPI002543C3F0|nr:S41 family peptidase [Chondrinema litorale]UZR94813.1 S41 family peptidase [Chondrinema litorale]